jgi:ferric-dicitrate binding protein FerR (iron transport regulator)
MNIDRFVALASAYGGSLHRWPAQERAQAEALAETEEGRAALQRAGALDTLLDDYILDTPSKILRSRILMQGKAEIAKRHRLWFWWSSLGLTAAGLAGAVAGVVAATVLSPPSDQEHAAFDANTTAFGEITSSRVTTEEDL